MRFAPPETPQNMDISAKALYKPTRGRGTSAHDKTLKSWGSVSSWFSPRYNSIRNNYFSKPLFHLVNSMTIRRQFCRVNNIIRSLIHFSILSLYRHFATTKRIPTRNIRQTIRLIIIVDIKKMIPY